MKLKKEQEFNNKIINKRKNDILSEILVKIHDFNHRKEILILHLKIII